MITADQFRAAVEAHLKAADVKPSRFGKDLLGDPNFVFDLRAGRCPNLDIVERVMGAIERAKPARPKAGAAA
jgi:homoserine dehydrogenase